MKECQHNLEEVISGQRRCTLCFQYEVDILRNQLIAEQKKHKETVIKNSLDIDNALYFSNLVNTLEKRVSELESNIAFIAKRSDKAEAESLRWKQKCIEANNEIALVYQHTAYCDDELLSNGAIKVKSTALLLENFKLLEKALIKIARIKYQEGNSFEVDKELAYFAIADIITIAKETLNTIKLKEGAYE